MFSALPILVSIYFGCVTTAEIANFAKNEINEDENGGVVIGDEEGREFPGIYPTYTQVPRTGFTCRGKLEWGYYADPETGCQVFHICETPYSKISFLCPLGSVFNQRHLVCDWFYNFDCNEAVDLYLLENAPNERRLGPEESGQSPDDGAFDLRVSQSEGILPIRDVKETNNRKIQPER